MLRMTPKFLYFDLGNVLVTFCNDRMVRQMAAVAGVDEALVRGALLPSGTPDDAQWRFECGQCSPDEYYRLFCDAIGASPPRAELELACSDIFGPIDESLQLVTRLAAAGHRLGILSNTNAVHWSFLTDGRFPQVNDAFELHVTSFDAGAMKPDRRIFEHAAQRAGVSLGEMFFTDDREDNVAGALAAGVDAVRFESTEQLADELHRRGVVWE
jgi:putative hydrolase of the HAD superfamily